ncbi:MAG TPA: hypothetical protein VH234_03665 [Candidatus Saccharimonadales bacterium]|nr:hypothetical protein [Candidatus Saccharimonadales bacterium]
MPVAEAIAPSKPEKLRRPLKRRVLAYAGGHEYFATAVYAQVSGHMPEC